MQDFMQDCGVCDHHENTLKPIASSSFVKTCIKFCINNVPLKTRKC